VALIVTPLDVAKVRMQAAGRFPHRGPNAVTLGFRMEATVQKSCPMKFFASNGIMDHCFDRRDSQWRHCFKSSGRSHAGLVQTLRNTWADGGFRGLYAGLPATLLIAVPNNVLYFASYEVLRDKLQTFAEPSGPVPSWAALIAGGGSRWVAATAVAPLEVVRTRAQAGRLAYEGVENGMARAQVVRNPGVRAMLAEIVREQGPRGLFLGLSSTLWRDVPFSALYWFGVERMREAILRRGWFEGTSVQKPLAALVAGALAGGSAAFATTPFDVVKTRQQLCRTAASSGGAGASSAEGLWATLARIAREEGARELLAGSVPRVARVAPACAIMLGSYETTKILWRRMREQCRAA